METVYQLCRMGQVAALATLLVAAFTAIVGSEVHAAILSISSMTMFTGAGRIALARRRLDPRAYCASYGCASERERRPSG
jgi:hypothetical protein